MQHLVPVIMSEDLLTDVRDSMRRYISQLGQTAHVAKRSKKLAIALAIAVSSSACVGNAPVAAETAERETPTVLAIRRCSGAVVNIHGQKTLRATAASTAVASEAGRQVNGMGTGVVIDPRGYVITNYHVVEDVDEVQITLADGTNTTADVVATEVRSDLALLKVKISGSLETIPRGTSSDLMIGEPVIAIGNAFGYVHTATQGIISALHRDVPVNDTQEYRDLIQTSAGINPGNSGGPLMNIHGEIIGVNVAVRVGAQQIAFAIPIDQAIDIVTDMISSHNEDRLSLGMRTEGGPRDGDGVVIASVAANSPAAREGFKSGDRIVQVGTTPINDRLDFGLAIIESRAGEKVPLQVERAGEMISLALAIEPTSATVGDDVQTLVWNALGIRAQPVSKATMQKINSRIRRSYDVGLYVSAVRKGSPAYNQGIHVGDVLIGLHDWQTGTVADLQSIMNELSSKSTAQSRFRIVRSNVEMEGYIRLADLPTTRTR